MDSRGRQPGAYQSVVTEALAALLAQRPDDSYSSAELRAAEVADRLAMEIAALVERAVSAIDEAKRAEVGAALARDLTALLVSRSEVVDVDDQVAEPLRLLNAVADQQPDGSWRTASPPLTPLLDKGLCGQTAEYAPMRWRWLGTCAPPWVSVA